MGSDRSGKRRPVPLIASGEENTMREDTLHCWYLGNPCMPRHVGEVRLGAGGRTCVLAQGDEWRENGFDLSPDVPREQRLCEPSGELEAPGALDDAMPDRWGERMIRVISRPSRMGPLDKLWFAGDRRFGALGVSRSAEIYDPCPQPPLIQASSLGQAEEIIRRVLERSPLDERERQLIASAGSMGGARPKMLVEHEGCEWVAKFPRGSNIDELLVEHAAMKLARRAGLLVAESRTVLGDIDHVLIVRRFDRDPTGRRHAISGRTALVPEDGGSYAALAGFLGKHAPPDEVRAQQLELFRRMVFNIMTDNTDDHLKNHAFLRSEDGTWALSPAYDIPPQTSGLGLQATQISDNPAWANRFDRDHAMAAASLFGLDPEEARQEWNVMAHHVASWRDVFAGCGVRNADLGYLSDFLDSDTLRVHRDEAMSRSRRRDAGKGPKGSRDGTIRHGF